MSGVRLRHVSLTNCTLVITHYRPYTAPYLCPRCQTTHTHKTYHLNLDSQCEVVVSKTIADRLAELPGLPLKTMGDEAHPRPQRLSMDGNGKLVNTEAPIELNGYRFRVEQKGA